jgi:hypothetical protein
MFSRIPPLVMVTPAPLALGVQFPSPFVGCATVLAFVVNRSVQFGFRLFDCMPAPVSLIRLHERRCRK